MAESAVDLDTLSDLCTPWCLRVVSTLRIAEQIAAGVNGIDDLAVAAQCDRDVLHSVLRHLVSKGVFEEQEPLTPTLSQRERAHFRRLTLNHANC